MVMQMELGNTRRFKSGNRFLSEWNGHSIPKEMEYMYSIPNRLLNSGLCGLCAVYKILLINRCVLFDRTQHQNEYCINAKF